MQERKLLSDGWGTTGQEQTSRNGGGYGLPDHDLLLLPGLVQREADTCTDTDPFTADRTGYIGTDIAALTGIASTKGQRSLPLPQTATRRDTDLARRAVEAKRCCSKADCGGLIGLLAHSADIGIELVELLVGVILSLIKLLVGVAIGARQCACCRRFYLRHTLIDRVGVLGDLLFHNVKLVLVDPIGTFLGVSNILDENRCIRVSEVDGPEATLP
jgi:hypothetical protein